MGEHRLTVERRGPQQYVPVCSCGHEQMNAKGTPFWNRAGALSGVLAHLKDVGCAMDGLPDYTDLDPSSSRGHGAGSR